MNFRNVSLLLVGLIAVVVLAACGGGGGQQDGSQGDQGSEAGKTDGRKEKTGKNRPDTQSLEGRVARVDLEKNRVVVRPEEGEPVNLLLRTEGEPATEITLDGNEASPEEIEQGQSAQVEYRVVKNVEKDRERNVALSVELTPARDGGADNEETTGG